MIAWIHRNLPIVLASILSVLVHTMVLFPLIEVIGSGRFDDDGTQRTLGRALPGLRGPDRELERKTDQLEHRERQFVRKLTIRRIQEEVRQRDPEEEKPPEPQTVEPEPNDIKVELGIDESDAVTMNWIGFAEYEKHLAALAEVEQAALRLESSSGSLGTAPPTVAPVAPAESVAMSPTPGPQTNPTSADSPAVQTETTLATPASDSPSTPKTATARMADDSGAAPVVGSRPAGEPTAESGAQEEALAPSEDRATAPTVPELIAREANESSSAPREAPPPAPPELLDRGAAAPSGADLLRDPREGADPDVVSPLPPGERIDDERDPTVPPERTEAARPMSDLMRDPANDPTRQTGAVAVPGGVAGPQTTPGSATTPSAPAPAGAPGDSRSEQGRLSTRESDPTSTIDVPQSVWQFGAPLARKGIRLDTVRPRFTTLNLIDGIRFNPIVELVIGRDGVPQHVVISRSTGNLGANEELRSTLYKWRASGKQLEQLKPGQTITIRLRLIMLQD